jgi:hypothetical protein
LSIKLAAIELQLAAVDKQVGAHRNRVGSLEQIIGPLYYFFFFIQIGMFSTRNLLKNILFFAVLLKKKQ